MRSARLLAVLATAGVLLAGCASDEPNGVVTEPDAGLVITIEGYAYSPLDVTVDAGTVIAVHNLDQHTHTLTSETNAGDYTPGAVQGIAFDTGPVDQGRWSTVVVPANAASGVTIPYFCTTHGAGMVTPDGHITVR